MQGVKMLLKVNVTEARKFKKNTPTTTYPYDIPDELPWETNLQQCTLQNYIAHYSKLRKDHWSLELLAEIRHSPKIVVHSLRSFIDIYKNLGPTTNCFIDMMRCIKDAIMGPDKWAEVSKSVTKAHAQSIFNFKEGHKRKIVKV